MHPSPSSARVDITYRPDGRAYLSIDVWTEDEFDAVALPSVPRPLFTLIDSLDTAALKRWHELGFEHHRSEGQYVLATRASPASEVDVEPFGASSEEEVRQIYDALKAEVEAGPGWHTMPAELVPAPVPADPGKYAIARVSGRAAGLIRVTGRPRPQRIGLVGVLGDHQGRGIGTALVAYALADLDRRGIPSAVVEIDDSNTAAISLAAAFAAERTGTLTELVLR